MDFSFDEYKNVRGFEYDEDDFDYEYPDDTGYDEIEDDIDRYYF